MQMTDPTPASHNVYWTDEAMTRGGGGPALSPQVHNWRQLQRNELSRKFGCSRHTAEFNCVKVVTERIFEDEKHQFAIV